MITILRGVPGSGKSRLAQQIKAHTGARVASADDYFLDEHDAYVFDPAKLGAAHAACFRKVIYCVTTTPYSAVVDNTNIEAFEIAPYVAVANAFGHDHEVLEFACDVETALARNIHGVPRATIERMADRFERAWLPPFWKRRAYAP